MRFALPMFVLLVFATSALAAPVAFRFAPPEGRDITSASVRGTFNGWGETAMSRGEGGVWSVTIDLPPGEHQYKYFVNGEWPGDMSTYLDGAPADPEAERYADDGFGGKNAVRVVVAGGAAASPAPADAKPAPTQAEGTARIHYHRPDGAYDGWGLHVWEDADHPGVTWTSPLNPAGTDGFGLWWDVKLKAPAQKVGFIVHKGDVKDPGADMFLEPATHGREVWIVSGRPDILTERPDVSALVFGDLSAQRAHWLDRATIAWRPSAPAGAAVALHADPEAKLELSAEGVKGGARAKSWTLEPADRMSEDLARRFPHLRALSVYRLAGASDDDLREALRGQVIVSAGADGRLRDVTGLQIAGVLDDLYAADGEPGAPPLGVSWEGDRPRLRVWAPTAKQASLVLYASATGGDSTVIPMSRSVRPAANRGDATAESGTWTVAGEPAWEGGYYRFAIDVYVPRTQRIESYPVTDPYSRSLSMNSLRSQIIRMNDPALTPEGWDTLQKPPLAAPEDAVIYELHVRDFSVLDRTVPEAHRGTYLAFTDESDGTKHLRALAASGLTHVHLLPAFDIATIDEDRSTWADTGDLSKYAPDSEEQQAAVARVQGRDGYNWGYDPFHFGVPEGSYSTDPDGPARILEFRRMVQALNGMGLRVVMDVVYNHTNASGMGDKSVLDRVVPGYYHRLNDDGRVETSTCCQNTASENMMMERLMVDDLVHWARDMKVDGFRFDLMGHHMKRNMVAVRRALDALTLEKDGADGRAIILYGEGWDFGEVGQGKRGQNATQQHMAGTGIATFNDRIRDAIRGGNPFGDRREQGFATGLYVAPNGFQGGGAGEQAKLLEAMDRIRVGLAGNLASYRFIDRNGREITGGQLDYGGYTRDPQESINYASAHDNETLWDKIVYAAPREAGVDVRTRMQGLALSAVLLAQGVPFLHAGSEMLRSKSMDADSYNSGDWFNGLDWTYATNRFGIGLPIAEKNRERWPIIRPLLTRADRVAGEPAIEASISRAHALLAVRRSSPLFRLRTAEDVQARVRFHNTGPGQTPGLIAMSLHDDGDLADLDPAHERIVVLFNARPEAARFALPAAKGGAFTVHPALAVSGDAAASSCRFDAGTGTFEVPAWTTGVFAER